MSALQQTHEWYEQRVGRITASRVGAILGVSPFATCEDVMRDMVREYHGAEREFTGNIATEWGVSHEDEAIAAYEGRTGALVVSHGLIIHPDYDWLACSPDGLVGDDGGLECKCPYSQTIKTLDEQPHYMAQVKFSLAVTGRKWWDFVCWTPDDYHCERVEYDPDWLPERLPTLEVFYNRYNEIISSDDLSAPYLKPLELDLSADHKWLKAAQVYQYAKKAADQAAEVAAIAKEDLIEIARETGAKKCVGAGVMAYKSERKGNIDYGKIPALEGVDLEQYRKKSTEYWSVK